MSKPALLVLEDGSIFQGESIGVLGSTVGEVVFNTSMTGYQEILSDPSYSDQIVTFTYPHIGNIGTNEDDNESAVVYAKGMIIRDLSITDSSFRRQESLADYLKRNQIVAIAGVDTRRLTRLLREKGAMNGCIICDDNPDEQIALKMAKECPSMKNRDLARQVTTKQSYRWLQGTWQLSTNTCREYTEAELPYHVVVYDYGVKRNILRMLVDVGCHLTVVPATTTAAEVLALNPDGVFLSNGPGDPAPCDYAIKAIQQLLGTNIPLFGICLGHQLLALALGAKTVKMKFGHHGGNHPVKDLQKNSVMITAQNHGFSVDESSLPAYLTATHRSLFDQTLQGIHHTTKPAFSFQGHPEASPGPHDAAWLFNHFIELIKEYRSRSRK